MAKYYTPSIEEFHVGFEYEELIGVDNEQEDWSCKSFNPKNYIDRYGEYTFDETPLSDWIRVKYLDKEDIEELGFEESLDEPDEWFWKFKGNIGIQLYFDDKYRNKDQGIGITIYDDKIIFSGYIKNKSELKVLLKQLGING